MLLVSTEQCKSGIFHINPDKFDTKLDRYKIRTFENISPRACFDKCIRRPRCHSYNYNRHVLRCELNYQPTYVSFRDFLNEVGFTYVEVDHYREDPLYDTCFGNPCKPGEICEGTNDGGVFCVKEHEEIDEDDCTNLKKLNPNNESGVYTVYPSKTGEGLQVFCDMKNGGWTVIQRRINGSEDFSRNWVEYENGFGDLQYEFWLGLQNFKNSSLEGKTCTSIVFLFLQTASAEVKSFIQSILTTSYWITAITNSPTKRL
ncbi:unnamed protein product [Mytilus coruscus]|uniref:Fibrinogen C-terminal domain-containing protein n=1 Tax=Mytilus coruscus TaxID=42192 RepID=A0A6J8DLB8_MYTCO|nr:unnamed protein product [Mytilus coruscus]